MNTFFSENRLIYFEALEANTNPLSNVLEAVIASDLMTEIDNELQASANIMDKLDDELINCMKGNMGAEKADESERYSEPSAEKQKEIFKDVESRLRDVPIDQVEAAFLMALETSPASVANIQGYFKNYKGEEGQFNVYDEAQEEKAKNSFINQMLPQIEEQPDLILLFRNVLQIDLEEKERNRKPNPLDYVGIKNFDSEVENFKGGPVVVELGTSWCKACESQEASMAQLSPNIRKFKVDCEQEPYLQRKYMPKGKTSYPTTLIFMDGKVVETFQGKTEGQVLAQAVEKYSKK